MADVGERASHNGEIRARRGMVVVGKRAQARECLLLTNECLVQPGSVYCLVFSQATCMNAMNYPFFFFFFFFFFFNFFFFFLVK
jgi:hypothetical protein